MSKNMRLITTNEAMSDSPKVSVIIPIYKQWEFLPDLINALIAQDFQIEQNGEVLLIDNEPDTEFLRPRLPSWIKLISCYQPGSYAARNLGAMIAKGKLLVFTDADCKPRPNWLSTIFTSYEDQADKSNGLLAGPVVIPLQKTASIWQTFDAVRGIPQEKFISRGYAATANLAVPRTLFNKLSGFDTKRLSGGDAEFCRRARLLGYSLRLIPEAIVDHPARDNFYALAVKARRIKGGQIVSGSFINRTSWLVRSLFPPFRESLSYLRSNYDFRSRMVAVVVRFMLWGVELHEITRLLLRRTPPERR